MIPPLTQTTNMNRNAHGYLLPEINQRLLWFYLFHGGGLTLSKGNSNQPLKKYKDCVIGVRVQLSPNVIAET